MIVLERGSWYFLLTSLKCKREFAGTDTTLCRYLWQNQNKKDQPLYIIDRQTPIGGYCLKHCALHLGPRDASVKGLVLRVSNLGLNSIVTRCLVIRLFLCNFANLCNLKIYIICKIIFVYIRLFLRM